jgi:hypothetical protein
MRSASIYGSGTRWNLPLPNALLHTWALLAIEPSYAIAVLRVI